MTAYIVVDSKIIDVAQQTRYREIAGPIVEKFGGEYLARGGKLSVKEHQLGTPARLVIVKFPSFERAEAFYNSQEYKAALAVSDKAAQRTFSIVEGL
jgi:uncharacterized protein (DUF1330 family)